MISMSTYVNILNLIVFVTYVLLRWNRRIPQPKSLVPLGAFKPDFRGLSHPVFQLNEFICKVVGKHTVESSHRAPAPLNTVERGEVSIILVSLF